MYRQVRLRLVALRALFALERLQAGVFATVRPQFGGRHEAHAALVAHKPLDTVVAQPMVAQHHLVFKAFRAQIARERQLGGVGQLVRLQAVGAQERLSAQVADKRLGVVAMAAAVQRQRRLQLVRAIAAAALERQTDDVDLLVSAQAATVGKLFLAGGTF